MGDTYRGSITTDRVDLIDIENGFLVTKTKIYKLGNVDKVWAKNDSVGLRQLDRVLL